MKSKLTRYYNLINTEKNQNLLVYLLSAVVCIWTIYPTLVIAKYSYPVQDDFAYMTHIRNYMEAGNGVFKACILQTIEYYNHFVGAYSSSFLGHLFEHIIQGRQRGITIFEITSILIFDVAIFLFIYAFVKIIFGYRNVAVACVYALMISFINNVIYFSDAEDYYWLITSIQYLLLLSFSLIGTFMTIVSVDAEKKWTSVTLTVLASVFVFVAAGSNLCLSFINVELVFIAGLCIFATKGVKKNVFIPFAFACLGTLINGIAPGNYERKGEPVTINMLIHAVLDSFRYSYARVEKMFSKPLFVVLLVLLILVLVRYSGTLVSVFGKYRFPIISALFMWAVVSAAIFPGILGYGYNIYEILMRGNFLSDFMIYFSFLLVVIYTTGWLKNKYFADKTMKVRGDVIIAALFISIICFAKLRDNEWKWTPVVRMYREINSGRMQEYSDYVWNIYGHLEQDSEEDVVLYINELEDKTCMISPYFAYGDHDENYKNYDAAIVRYYKKNALYLYNAEE